jgi:hypothetical protein
MSRPPPQNAEGLWFHTSPIREAFAKPRLCTSQHSDNPHKFGHMHLRGKSAYRQEESRRGDWQGEKRGDARERRVEREREEKGGKRGVRKRGEERSKEKRGERGEERERVRR